MNLQIMCRRSIRGDQGLDKIPHWAFGNFLQRQLDHQIFECLLRFWARAYSRCQSAAFTIQFLDLCHDLLLSLFLLLICLRQVLLSDPAWRRGKTRDMANISDVVPLSDVESKLWYGLDYLFLCTMTKDRLDKLLFGLDFVDHPLASFRS